MAQMPGPTKTQLRQHALDRALIDPIVHNLSSRANTPEKLAKDVLTVAAAFADWLGEDPQPQADQNPRTDA